MGRAIDLFVTYRFLKILVTPFKEQEAYKLGIIDEKGNRVVVAGTTNKATDLNTAKEKIVILQGRLAELQSLKEDSPKVEEVVSPEVV